MPPCRYGHGIVDQDLKRCDWSVIIIIICYDEGGICDYIHTSAYTSFVLKRWGFFFFYQNAKQFVFIQHIFNDAFQ